MRRLYQTEWHGIPFKSFTKMDSTKVADPLFYKTFYRVFFQKYKNWNDLSPEWVQLKLQTVEFLKNHHAFKKEGNILSIGCGLGIMEKALIDAGYRNLEITEVLQDSLCWIRPHISPEKIYIGDFQNCIPENCLYQFIYLSCIEYLFNQPQLISFLKSVKARLSPGGCCLQISVSCESMNRTQSIVAALKDITRLALEKLDIRHRGQLWGYLRNRKEFYNAMQVAGFTRINDGFLEKKTQWETYWIEGYNE